jgi:predicted RNase H-like HicB family nuclease
MLVSYPALFYYDKSESVPFFVTFPDFKNSATQGENVSDALAMASDYLGITVADDLQNNRQLPKPTDINSLSLKDLNPYPDELNYDEELSFTSMVLVDLSDYLEDDKPVKKTLTIPTWADKLGKELKLNFSKTLTDAIAEKKLEK